MRVFFGFLGLFFYEWLLNHAGADSPTVEAIGRRGFSPSSCTISATTGIIAGGHTVGLFWAAHVVHHQSEEFNLTTALRQTGTGAILSWIFYLAAGALAGCRCSCL